MKKVDVKYIVIGIVLILLAVVGLSYSYFTRSVNDDKTKVNLLAKTLNIIFIDGEELTKLDIKPGWSISKKFSVENQTDKVFNYNIKIEDLINTFVVSGGLQYKITSTSGYNMTEFKDVPKGSEKEVLAYDIDINGKEKHEYTIEFKYEDLADVNQSEDMGKDFSGKLQIVNGTVDPSILYKVSLNISNGSVEGENEKETIKNGSVEYNISINEGYKVENENIECDGGATGKIEGNKVTIEGITQEQTCTVTPVKKKYNLVMEVSGGSTSPTNIMIEHGSNRNFTITPSSSEYTTEGMTVSCKNTESGVNVSKGTVSGSVVSVSNVTENMTCKVTVPKKPTLKAKIISDHSTVLTRSSFDSVLGTETATEGTIYKTTESWETEDGSTVYYFAGNVSDNWVKFGKDSNNADLYWRIIRTNEDGSVRLLYAGTSPDTTKGYLVRDSKSCFNEIYNNTMYVGYMYGTMGSLENNRTNENDSTVKTAIDEWYSSGLNIKKDSNNRIYDSYVSKTAIYCNDRSTGEYLSNGIMYYAGFNRLDHGDVNNNPIPSYKCGYNSVGGYLSIYDNWNETAKSMYSNADVADKFSVDESKGGNGDLTYPVGLMTLDEAAYAGGKTNVNDTYNYYNLNSKNGKVSVDWLTMTPSSFGYGYARVGTIYANGLGGNLVDSGYVYRPVISLKSCAKWSKGTGTSSSPYQVSIDSTCASAVN